MIHAFRLGPFTVGRRDAYAYAAVDEAGAMVRPEVARGDEEGLRKLGRSHAGSALRCEPSLAEAGRVLGFEPAPLPRSALLPRAVLAFGLGQMRDAEKPPLEVLVRFFEACAAFWKARPWELLDSDSALPAELVDARGKHVREVSVMGAGGQEFGLAVYDEPGSIERVTSAVERGRMQDAARVGATSVLLDDEPAWAAAAFEDALGLPWLPVPLRIRKGRSAAPSADELLDLAAALEAVAALVGPAGFEPATARVDVAGRTVTARVRLAVEPELDDDLAEPMLVPEPFAPAQRAARTPRNAPCPCGSGRKYKKCHLAEDEERERAARGTGPAAEEAREVARRREERDPIHALDERITADALALARRRWGRAFDPEGALREAGLDLETTRSLLGWGAGHHRGPDGRTALELYLEQRGGGLDEEGRRLVSALRAAWFSVHEVTAVVPGESITLRDLLAGGERVVSERTASRTVRVREVLLARVLDLGDRAVLAGCHLRPLGPRDGDLARRFARKVLRVRTKVVAPERLRALSADPVLFQGWQEIVAAREEQPLPRVQNTDGEDFLLTVDRFDIAAGRTAAVIDALLALPGAQREDAGGETPAEIAFVREGNAKGVMDTTLVGRALVEDRRLRLETNSIPRADRLRALVQERLGGEVTFRVREHSDPAAQLGDGASRRGTETPAGAAPPPELLEVMRRMQEEHYRRWLDEPVPALGGLTPREAARRKGAVREELAVLLAELEHMQARLSQGERVDVAALRRELGMES